MERMSDTEMSSAQEVCGCTEEMLKLRIVIEVLRYGCACRLAKALADLSERELPHGRQDRKGLISAVIFEGLQSAAVHGTSEIHSRNWVHPVLDVHRRAKVCEKKDLQNPLAVTYTLEGVALKTGCVLGVLRTDKENGSIRQVPLNELQLLEEASFFHDELLPAVECIGPQQASKSALNWFLEKLCGASTKLLASFNQKRRRAWELTDRVTILFYEERRRLAELKERAKQEKIAIEVGAVKLIQRDDGDDMMLLEFSIYDRSNDGWFFVECPTEMTRPNFRDVSVKLEIHVEHVARLRRLAACTVDSHFFLSLGLMLLRYAGLTGGAWQLESGWHAGVPRSVFGALVDAFRVTGECFASPLNCTLPRYFSAFPDTDSFFGCCGNFFVPQSLRQTKEEQLSLEANPPFDHEVIAAALARALQCLEDTPPTVPALFVFVLPESTRANGIAVRHEAEKSRFFRADCILSPHLSRFVDGARHTVRRGKRRRETSLMSGESGELVTLSCPTRLLVLQNDAAAAMFPAQEGLAKVRSAWEAL